MVTGKAGLSPIGSEWTEVEANLRARRGGVVHLEEWDQYEGLNTRLGAPVPGFSLPKHYNRKIRRSMGRVSQLATRASELALDDAGLIGDPVLTSGRTGVSYGSSTGATDSVRDFGHMFHSKSTDRIQANTYIRMMPHTAAVAVGMFFGMTGRILPSSTACTSGSLSVGMAYEAIKYGYQDVMVAGGSEELCVSEAAVFDTLYATSTWNDRPDQSPRPFDRDRDGLVIGEGAGSLVLEELGRAQARGARIHAEIIGFATNSDGVHHTQPTAETMAMAMKLALDDAELSADRIDYVSAHGTATDLGDIAESHATAEVFGDAVPISSLKSYMGHTLGACGALEAWMTLQMMQDGWFAPTINLDNVDPRCAELDYVTGDGREIQAEHVMSNNFAFGGVNTSLVFRRWA